MVDARENFAVFVQYRSGEDRAVAGQGALGGLCRSLWLWAASQAWPPGRIEGVCSVPQGGPCARHGGIWSRTERHRDTIGRGVRSDCQWWRTDETIPGAKAG